MRSARAKKALQKFDRYTGVPPVFVHYKEVWGQWLHLAAGLHAGESCPMPSPDIDLEIRYGPEHAPVTEVESAKAELSRKLLAPLMIPLPAR